MTISTVSFNNAKFFKNKMFFILEGKDNIYMQVFDKDGKNLLNRVSYKPDKVVDGDLVIITRKNEYEIPSKNVFFEYIERVYDKAGKLLKVQKHTVKP